MKILQIISSLQMGGAERLITEIVPRLINMGHNVDVLVFEGSKTPFMRLLQDNGVKVFSINHESTNPYCFRNILGLLPFMRKYDIIHTHTTPAQIIGAISNVISFSNTRLITTEHSTYNHRRGKWYFKFFDMIIYHFYSKIICIGEKVKNNLEEQIGKQGDKIVVIENGIDVNSFQKALPIIRSLIMCSDNDFVLTMVGRFTDAKDQSTIIKSLLILPEIVKLVLVGDGPNKGDIQMQAIQLGLGNRVVFLGTRNDVPSILQASDIVVMSSHWEGFGLAAVEGMACGKPVIASDVHGLRDVVKNAGVLFRPGDSTQLAEIVVQLMSDRELYNLISNKCYDRASDYDIDIVVHKYENVYNIFKK